MVDASQIAEYFFFGWICFTIPIQLLVIVSLVRKFSQLKMNKSFFMVYTVNTFVDFANQMCMILGVLFPAWGFFIPVYLRLGSDFGKYLLIGLFWTRISQGIACLLIALNRCSAIIWPLNYERIWTNTVIYFGIFVQLFSGFPFAIFASSMNYTWLTNISTAEEYGIDQPDVRVSVDNDNEVQILKIIWVDNADGKRVFIVGFVIEIIICIILILCYIIIGCVMKKRKEIAPAIVSSTKYESSSTFQRKTVNKQLFRMAASVCTIEILFTLFMLSIVTVEIHPNLFYVFYNSLSILYSTLNPYVLLICSSYTRRLLKETCNEISESLKCDFKKIISTGRASIDLEMPTLSTVKSSSHRK